MEAVGGKGAQRANKENMAKVHFEIEVLNYIWKFSLRWRTLFSNQIDEPVFLKFCPSHHSTAIPFKKSHLEKYKKQNNKVTLRALKVHIMFIKLIDLVLIII